jgi:hypothetical protein
MRRVRSGVCAALFQLSVCVCSDDLRVEPDAGSTKLCQSATLRVSGLRNQFTDVLENDASSVTLSDSSGNKLSKVLCIVTFK